MSCLVTPPFLAPCAGAAEPGKMQVDWLAGQDRSGPPTGREGVERLLFRTDHAWRGSRETDAQTGAADEWPVKASMKFQRPGALPACRGVLDKRGETLPAQQNSPG